MFQILVTFKNAEPLLFTTTHYTTMDQVEQRFVDSPPWTLTTEKGPITVEGVEPDIVVIQHKMGNRIIERKTLVYKEDKVEEQTDPISEEVEEILEQKEGEAMSEAQVPEVMDPIEDEAAEKQILVSSAYTKFVGFREKFLRQSAEASSWEDQIIEKQADYIKKLKRVHGELSTRHEDATALEDRIVGK